MVNIPPTQFQVFREGEDLPSPAALHELADVYGHAFAGAQHAEELILKELAAGHEYIIAIRDGRIIGFVSWRTWGEPRHQMVELHHIGRDLQNPRAAGVGRLLIEELEHRAHQHFRQHGLPGARLIFLFTHRENTEAQAVYLRAGFIHEATLPHFFHPDRGPGKSGDEFYFAKSFPAHVVR